MMWRDYGGAEDSSQYSALQQINRSNVNKLEIAWIYPTGDNNKYFFNPIVVDGLMYVLAKNNSVIALDASTGKEVWVHQTDPETRLLTNRGINYWESRDRSDRRLLFASNNFLRAIDARTGMPILSFGSNGSIDLREGLGRDPKTLSLVQSTTPGRVFENLLILGSATNEGYGSAPGDIRAYDVRTGKLAWTFHTVPHPGEFGYDTWPKDAWKTVGGANSWSELSLDEKRGIVYIPTASPKYNFYGADRKGANLFGDCLLALDARTGKRLWHFQMVHHDIWDYDNPNAPKLLTVRHNGKLVDAVAQAGKEGFLWVFNRVTGEPLWPIEERKVPRSEMPGEEAWPTQPFPLKPPPFARQTFTEKDLSPFIEDAKERARFRDEILSARNEGLFTPPGLRNTIEMPGNNGGANWGGTAVDPTNGTLYVVSKDLPCMLKLEPERTKARSDRLRSELPLVPPRGPNGRASCGSLAREYWEYAEPGTDQQHCAPGARIYAGFPKALERRSELVGGLSFESGSRVSIGAGRDYTLYYRSEVPSCHALGNCAVRQRIWLHVYEHGAFSDRSALVIAYGLRPQRGDNQVENSARRRSRACGQGHKRHRLTFPESRSGCHGGRVNFHGHTRP
jgi:quinoprotein glucose dehydrogenase